MVIKANKRLRKLLDAGLVQVWVRSLLEENIYAVAQEGIDLLHAREVEIDLTATAPRRLDGNLDHLLLINQIRIALALDLTDSSTWQI